MKKQSASNYQKQVAFENVAAILFSVLLTAMLVMNMESVIELTKSIGF